MSASTASAARYQTAKGQPVRPPPPDSANLSFGARAAGDRPTIIFEGQSSVVFGLFDAKAVAWGDRSSAEEDERPNNEVSRSRYRSEQNQRGSRHGACPSSQEQDDFRDSREAERTLTSRCSLVAVPPDYRIVANNSGKPPRRYGGASSPETPAYELSSGSSRRHQQSHRSLSAGGRQ